jgi:hypothetical protein
VSPIFHSLEYACPVSFNPFSNSNNLPNDIEKPAESVDISNDSMRISTSASSLSAGSMIKIKVPISGLEISIPVLAEVIWVRKHIQSIYNAGLRFLQ